MPIFTSFAQAKYSGLRLLALSIAVLMLGACGSTKVYNSDKTIVFRNSIYNISTVKQIGTDVSAKLLDGSIVDLTNGIKTTFSPRTISSGLIPIPPTVKYRALKTTLVRSVP